VPLHNLTEPARKEREKQTGEEKKRKKSGCLLTRTPTFGIRGRSQSRTDVGGRQGTHAGKRYKLQGKGVYSAKIKTTILGLHCQEAKRGTLKE